MRAHAAIVPRGQLTKPLRGAPKVAGAGLAEARAVTPPTRAQPDARAKMPDSNSLLDKAAEDFPTQAWYAQSAHREPAEAATQTPIR